MRLTEHFSIEEFERSTTATKLGIDNRVPQELIPNIKNLCQQVLEPLRRHAGTPIPISSGYRCPRLNAAVGGAKRSYHLQARAADIPFHLDWYIYIRDHLPHTELINEGTWIHVAL